VTKTVYEQAKILWPDGLELEPEAILEEDAAQEEKPHKKIIRGIKMSDKDYTKADVDREKEKAAEEARKALLAEQEAEKKAAAEKQAEIDEAVKAAKEELEAEHKAALEKKEEEAKKSRRLPDKPDAPYKADFAEIWKYDNLSPEDQAVMVGILQAAKVDGTSRKGASENALKALAIKLDEDKTPYFVQARNAMKYAGIKSDEIQQQDLTSYGDEWVGVAYSNALWEAIRAATFVADKLPKIEVPPGHESIVIPLESGDPTFYKVSEATDTGTSGWPNATITSSQMGTAQKTLSLVKMGARVLWSGELEEDSLIPFVAQLRMQLQKGGAEQLEHAIIDGDTATTASTNINDIGGTPGGSEMYLLFNGFRKSCLVTTTANSRSGGAITDVDFLETLKLMGTAGLNGADVTKVAFIQDGNVRWKTLEIATVKTRDVFSSPTIENGALNGIWGYPVYTSYQMHRTSSVRKANTDGKVDETTTTNNTTGSILAVRWDQWMLGYRRRMTMETTRIARADTTEIVALARLGLVQRDTEASAISYGLSV
jgi:hypothetical protein